MDAQQLPVEPIAITGFSFRMPQDAVDEKGLWGILEKGTNVKTKWPPDRTTTDAFHDDQSRKPNTLPSHYAHFMREDPGVFDAPFFSITAKEAASMSPRQPGIPVEQLRGSLTAVYAASMADDWTLMAAKDADTVPRMIISGHAATMLPNKISWFFDLRGPSVHIDTACSSGLTALDLACQSILTGNCKAALVIGSSTLLSPEPSLQLANLNFLSPDGCCHSFDARANGYGRGEGVVALYLKPLRRAVHDGDVVRAIVRATASNQDGKTPGLTQPSSQAQADLIRFAYAKAGLDLNHTTYVEAHGTGTPTGDPIEVKAIGGVFGKKRTPGNPLYVGSIKANVGHLEGSSGPASVVKAVMMIERGIPTVKTRWPGLGQRRVSVNSFGFGGANTHVIVDDAFHYMQAHGIHGFYRSINNLISTGTHLNETSVSTADEIHCTGCIAFSDAVNGDHPTTSIPRLLIWSAADEAAIHRMLQSYGDYYSKHIINRRHKIDQLAYTLAARRSIMSWRSFAVVENDSGAPPTSSQTIRLRILRCSSKLRSRSRSPVCWYGVGLDELLAKMLADVISDAGRINTPDCSQPVCTALQIGLVDLLESFKITPSAVVGHSSGEIAAAYAMAALSYESACKVAYYRGKLTGSLARQLCVAGTPGAMLSANLREAEVPEYLEGLGLDTSDGRSVCLACVNSPENVTLAGPVDLVDIVKKDLDKKGIFAQNLTTGVAYHSPSMQLMAEDYAASIGFITPGSGKGSAIFVSSVTGKVSGPEELATPQYWVNNLTSPVRFSHALAKLTSLTTKSCSVGTGSLTKPFTITDVVEVGPHAALRRPVRDTCPQLRYHAWIQRSISPIHSTLNLVGNLFCLGYLVSVTAANHQNQRKHPYLVDCPSYPFDHTRRYWDESRMSKDWRLREASPGFLLGRRAHDWNPLRPRWRNWLCGETMPWLGEHHVTGTLVVPGAGSLVIAIEAVRQTVGTTGRKISGFEFRNLQLLAPLRVGDTTRDAVETEVHLDSIQGVGAKESTWFQFRIFSHNNGHVTETCNAQVQVQFEEDITTPAGHERALEDERIRSLSRTIHSACTQPLDIQTFYKRFFKYGFRYGPSFTVVTEANCDPVGQASGTGKVSWDPAQHEQAGDSPVHPAILDGVLQVLLAAAPKDLGDTATVIPRRMGKVWMSNKVWSQTTRTVNVAGIVNGTPDEGGPFMNFWALADDNTPLCSIENVKGAEISRKEKNDDAVVDRRLLYRIAWKPKLCSLAPGEVQKICDTTSFRLDNYDSEVHAFANFFPKIEKVMRSAAIQARQTVSTSQMSALPAYFSKYVNALDQQSDHNHATLGNQEKNDELSLSSLDAAILECELEYPQWSLFPTFARALPSILRGEVNPLELMFASNAAEKFYASVYGFHMLSGGFQNFLNIASHENPRQRILEVGAGTGSFTRHILSALQDIEEATGGSSFAEYVFTDISASLVGNAQAQFQNHLDRMKFMQWDIEHDPSDGHPGLDIGGYDFIFAGSVLHATSNLSKALRNLRALLKPEGYLILQETTSTQTACINIAFGALEGWWLSTENWRQGSPLLTQERWNQVLQDNGFHAIDLALKDFQDDAHHIGTIMVAKATPEEHLTLQSQPDVSHQARPQLVLVTDRGSVDESSLTRELQREFEVKQVVDFDAIEQGWESSPSDVVVSLIDFGYSQLTNLDAQRFENLQRLIHGSKNILWVSVSVNETAVVGEADVNDGLPIDPQSGVATGMLRTIRSEESDKHIVTLSINQAHTYKQAEVAAFVSEILHLSFKGSESRDCSEVEFIVQDGHITVGRMVHAKQLDEERVSHIRPLKRTEEWGSGPSLVLQVEHTGVLDSLRFVEDQSHQNELLADEVEIEAEAWPISFRDVFIALGKLRGADELGYECAGKVTRVGSAGSGHVKPGDRVVMGMLGSMRSHPRSKLQAVHKIPDTLSCIDAVSHVNPAITAWHSLVNLARLQKGETVLIHSAAGGTGQMAIGIAQMIGAEIFATVGSEDKKRLLVEEFHLQREHIFYSRDTSFANGVRRVTNGRGVDVVLNSLAGEGLRASWECIAPFGRFIEIGKADIMANSSLPMGTFAKNITFAAMDLVSIVKTNVKLAGELFHKAMELITDGLLKGPKPLHLYPLAETENAFRFMQSGNNTGRIVITGTKCDQVTKYLVHRSAWRFNAEVTYVVIGGLGGLGRVVIEWMARKGARNLLVPSRSGISSQAASDIVAKLRDEGVCITTPKCDVSSIDEFSKVLESYASSNPQVPIKGCINSAMSLQDAIFSNMTHGQWTAALQSKVQSSWNAHTLLPRDMDYFIMLSSLVGVYGAMGQSNYAAGCAFQDALAKARTEANGYQGISVSLDLGWLLDAGIVSEREDYRRKWEGAQDIAGVRCSDLIAVLDHYCDPARWSALEPDLPRRSGISSQSQLLVGAVTPADLARHGEMIPASMSTPLFDAFRSRSGTHAVGSGIVTSESQAMDAGARFRAATSFDEKCSTVIDAIRSRLARALDVEIDDVDAGRPVSSYGVDSLMAVELRNWMRKDYDVEIAVFDILGGTTIADLGRQVTNKAAELEMGPGDTAD
ncbi:polyketide synthase PksD [Apiospora marii]|uniref:polyketide synthase PksD n=1 Tax=Apiospora marii TaxID=335849 RepID=UPI00312E9347